MRKMIVSFILLMLDGVCWNHRSRYYLGIWDSKDDVYG